MSRSLSHCTTCCPAYTCSISSPSDDDLRKFNIIVFGVNECNSGTPRHNVHTWRVSPTVLLSKLDHCFNPLSIRDLFQLGKYSTSHVLYLLNLRDIQTSGQFFPTVNLYTPSNLRPFLTILRQGNSTQRKIPSISVTSIEIVL